MNGNYTLFEGFIAASLHDIGKLALDNNTWAHHWDLEKVGNRTKIDLIKKHGEHTSNREKVGNRTKIDFVELLGENIVNLISIHHGNVKKGVFDLSKLSKIEYALALSDKIQSSMLPNEDDIEKTVGEDKTGEMKSSKKYFIPYYGTLERWDDSKAKWALREFTHKLDDLGSFKETFNHKRWANNILKIQDELLYYPFKTFIPHLSLAMHHQLSASLFLFLYDELEKCDNLKDLKEFKFSVIEITPDLLKTFYRMRDVSGLHSLTEELSTEIVNELFGRYRSELNGIPKKNSNPSNPFLFYNKNSLVLVHPSHETVLEKLRELLDKLDLFYSLTVKVNEYTSEIDVKPVTETPYKNIFVRRLQVSSKQYAILSDKILNYNPSPDYICMACGKAIIGNDKKEDDKGHILCDFCYNLRKKSTGYDLDVFGGPGERLSYIFLKLPDDLVEHTRKVAEDQLISRFLDESKIDPYSIPPTDVGILEYLQALRELSLFQDEIDHNITGDYETTLFNSPQFTGYLFRETDTQPWDFLRYLNAKRTDLKLNPSLVLMSCNTKTPFWSLIESMPTYNKLNGDVIYDISGGCVTMFQSNEVSRIRELAEIARNSNVTSTQLNSLSDVAMNTSIDELLLEMEVREDRLRQFGKRLADAINQLETKEGEYQNRIKRAVFIKYIGKLVPRSKNKYSKRRR